MFAKRSNATCLLLGTLIAAILTSDASAQVRFVNLSNDPIFIAKCVYQPYRSSSGGLMVITPEGWNYDGWWKVDPRGTFTSEVGSHFVENAAGRITWNNLNPFPGVIRNERFHAFVDRGRSGDDFARLEREGYRRVDYQHFDDGLFTIGNDYRLENRTFRFDFGSRDFQHHRKTFTVPGRVAYHTVQADDRWASFTWTQGQTNVTVAGTTVGHETRPFAGRERGYYTGSVIVYYTVPR